jgi:hypothetical protein
MPGCPPKGVERKTAHATVIGTDTARKTRLISGEMGLPASDIDHFPLAGGFMTPN